MIHFRIRETHERQHLLERSVVSPIMAGKYGGKTLLNTLNCMVDFKSLRLPIGSMYYCMVYLPIQINQSLWVNKNTMTKDTMRLVDGLSSHTIYGGHDSPEKPKISRVP